MVWDPRKQRPGAGSIILIGFETTKAFRVRLLGLLPNTERANPDSPLILYLDLCQSHVRSEGGRGGQDTVQCHGLPMTTSCRREWTEGRKRKDEKKDRYSD